MEAGGGVRPPHLSQPTNKTRCPSRQKNAAKHHGHHPITPLPTSRARDPPKNGTKNRNTNPHGRSNQLQKHLPGRNQSHGNHLGEAMMGWPAVTDTRSPSPSISSFLLLTCTLDSALLCRSAKNSPCSCSNSRLAHTRSCGLGRQRARVCLRKRARGRDRASMCQSSEGTRGRGNERKYPRGDNDSRSEASDSEQTTAVDTAAKWVYDRGDITNTRAAQIYHPTSPPERERKAHIHKHQHKTKIYVGDFSAAATRVSPSATEPLRAYTHDTPARGR